MYTNSSFLFIYIIFNRYAVNSEIQHFLIVKPRTSDRIYFKTLTTEI